VVVAGASGIVGFPLLPLLVRQGFNVVAISRQAQHRDSSPGVSWIKADLDSASPAGALPPVAVLIYAAPLWLLNRHLPWFFDSGIDRVIAFSSTSAETKSGARDYRDRRIAESLMSAENVCRDLCREHDVGLTLFRPTMIYGFGRDRNIMTIARFIRKFGFFAVAGEANGKRQPVHANDLAESCVGVLDNSRAINRTYNLSGGEVLGYRDMVERIFVGLAKTPRIIRLPVSLYRFLLICASGLNRRSAYSPDVADRMNYDLCFGHHAATADFGYRPAKFLIDPKQDLTLN
jgi:nucleoside-diphosphate-sugar epimerase